MEVVEYRYANDGPHLITFTQTWEKARQTFQSNGKTQTGTMSQEIAFGPTKQPKQETQGQTELLNLTEIQDALSNGQTILKLINQAYENA